MVFVTTFKKVMLAMDFRTPLNFLMLPTDFKKFYSVFYHSLLISEYVTNFYTDGLFTAEELKKRDLGFKDHLLVSSSNASRLKHEAATVLQSHLK